VFDKRPLNKGTEGASVFYGKENMKLSGKRNHPPASPERKIKNCRTGNSVQHYFLANYLESQNIFKEIKMQNPESLKYTKSDEWVKVDGNVATVGVTDYAQSQLSDIVYLEFLVEADDEISQGDSIVTLESVKAAADVNTPVSGKVLALNEDLSEGFESVNTDAFGKAWMIKLNLSDPSELNSLMSAEEYTKYCDTREH